MCTLFLINKMVTMSDDLLSGYMHDWPAVDWTEAMTIWISWDKDKRKGWFSAKDQSKLMSDLMNQKRMLNQSSWQIIWYMAGRCVEALNRFERGAICSSGSCCSWMRVCCWFDKFGWRTVCWFDAVALVAAGYLRSAELRSRRFYTIVVWRVRGSEAGSSFEAANGLRDLPCSWSQALTCCWLLNV